MILHGLLGASDAPPATVGFHWLPAAATEGAGPVDGLFELILWLGLFASTLLLGLLIAVAVQYRRRGDDAAGLRIRDENLPLTVFAVVVAAAVAVFVFYAGAGVHQDLATPPSDAYAVAAEADSGRVSWIYPNGHRTDSLHVPAARPVVVDMTARDAVYRLSIPAFRLGRDMVPGRETRVWFEAVEPGSYDVFAAAHGDVPGAAYASAITVQEPSDFDQWLAASSDILAGLTPVEGGRKLYEALTCIACHSLDGTKLVGPSFRGLIGSERVFRDGGSALADPDYVRESLLEPQARVVAGFEPVMPSFQGRVGDREVEALVAFMESLDGGVQ
ncbi:c-type cytochrome [bacterium]|nr:c-type cytochrome [bacterium]MBU1072326.1 c-type cytochrome [bacterium]MBU1674375.1 c-type cytochrome [bacterium]